MSMRWESISARQRQEGNPQARSVGSHQRGTITNGANMLEKLVHFGSAENHRQSLGNPAARQGIFRPSRFQGDVVQKLGSRNKGGYALRRIPAFIDHIKLVFTNLFQPQMFGAGLIESHQATDVMHIRSLAFGSEVAQL